MGYLPGAFFVFLLVHVAVSDICIQDGNVYPMDRDYGQLHMNSGSEDFDWQSKRDHFTNMGLDIKKNFVPGSVMDKIHKDIDARRANEDLDKDTKIVDKQIKEADKNTKVIEKDLKKLDKDVVYGKIDLDKKNIENLKSKNSNYGSTRINYDSDEDDFDSDRPRTYAGNVYNMHNDKNKDTVRRPDYERRPDFESRSDVDRRLGAETNENVVYDRDFQRNHKIRSEVDVSFRKDFFKDTFNKVKTHLDCPCICPSTIPKSDLTNPMNLDLAQKKLVRKMWNNQRMPRFSILGRRMKDAVLTLAHSDVPLFKKHAFYMSMYFFSYFPYSDNKYDLCPFATIVNASVAYEKARDVQTLNGLADVMTSLATQCGELVASNSLTGTGCGGEKPTVAAHTCQQDGAAYPLEELLELQGDALPLGYKRLLQNLHRSTYYADRLMAATAAAALTPQLIDFMTPLSMYTAFEFEMMQYSRRVPSCCCSFRQQRLQQLKKNLPQEMERMANFFKKQYHL